MTRVRNRLRVVAVLSGVLTTFVLTSAFGQAPRLERGARVAVMRADGVIVPFAEFARGWRPIWTGLEPERRTLPASLADVREAWWGRGGPAHAWQVWQAGRAPLPARVTGVRPIATPCGVEMGLATDFRAAGSPAPSGVAPYPKAALATIGAARIEPIVPLDRASPEFARVHEAMSREFNGREERALVDMQWAHPTPPGERRRMPFDLTAIWHVPGGRFFYVEAMRRYPERDTPAGAAPCDLVTFVSGYLWINGDGRLRPVLMGALVSYCHLEAAAFAHPLGQIRDGARVYWALESAGATREAYGVVEMLPERGGVRQHLWHVAGQCELK